jgi:hypothetical protein
MKNPEPVLSIVSGQPEPDPELERLLSAARDAAEPSDDNRTRVTRALALALPGTLVTDSFAPPESDLGSSGAALKSPLEPVTSAASSVSGIWLAAGGAAIGVIGFWLGHSVGRAETQHEMRALTRAVAQVSASPAPVAPTPALVPVVPALAPEVPAQPEPAAAELASAPPAPAPRALPKPRAAQVLRAATPPPAPPALNFREVLEQLRRAREQLRNGQATMSLLVLSELDRSAGDVLREERETTRVLALCAAGQDKAAREVAAQLEQLSPRSIYASRLANSCVVVAQGSPSGEAIGDTAPIR